MKKSNYFNKIGIGTSAYGSQLNSKESTKIIVELLDLGINYIDTSPFYGAGNAERIIGKAIKDRSKIIIATKFGLTYKNKNFIFKLLIPFVRIILKLKFFKYFISRRVVSHDQLPQSLSEIKESINSSLFNLNIKYLDILLIHNNIDYYLNNEEIVKYLLDLKNKGIIKKLGITTSLKDDSTIELLKSKKEIIDVIQIPLINYNYF